LIDDASCGKIDKRRTDGQLPRVFFGPGALAAARGAGNKNKREISPPISKSRILGILGKGFSFL
jgi:hypothetical protein